MNIVVCVKSVPDTAADKKFSEDMTVDRGSVEAVLNPLDEYGTEAALQLREAHGGEVTILCVGPESSVTIVRKALAMGADKGVLVSDPDLAGSDAWAVAHALSQALGKLEYDLCILGSESTDARESVVPSMVSEMTGKPGLISTKSIGSAEGTVKVSRETEGGYQVVEASSPAILSVVKGINEPRYPSFKGIMAAKQKPIETWSAADCGIDTSRTGLAHAQAKVTEITPRSAKEAGIKIEDDGTAFEQLADWLQEEKLL